MNPTPPTDSAASGSPTPTLNAHVSGPVHAREEVVTVLSDEQRLRLCELADSGMSVRQIAAELKTSPSTVTRQARAMGVAFDREATVRATEARIADGRARRTELAARLLDQVDGELDRMNRPCRVYAFVGGQAPQYLEHVLPQPDATTRLAMARTATTLLDRHIRLAEMDSDSGVEGARSMIGDIMTGLHQYAQDRKAKEGPGWAEHGGGGGSND